MLTPAGTAAFTRRLRGRMSCLGLWLCLLLAAPGTASAQPEFSSCAAHIGEPVTDILQRCRAAGLALVFSNQLITSELRAAHSVPAQHPRNTVRTVLHGLGLQLTEVQGIAFVVRASQSTDRSTTGHLSGVVRRSSTRERIVGAQIELRRLNTQALAALASTDSAGDFHFSNLPAGTYQVHITAAELQPYTSRVSIAAGRTSVHSSSLQAPTNALETVTVNASRYALSTRAQQSTHTLTRDQIEALPALSGDPMRAVAHLPGMASNGFGATFNVRGGAVDETGIFLDGIQLFEPFHLKNFQEVFSTISDRLVSHMEVFTGGFPAQYGNRLSGIVQIRSLGRQPEPHHELYLDLFHAGALSTGQFNNNASHWLASIRRGNMDLVADSIDPGFGQPSYIDLQARISHELSPRTEISASVMHNRDRIRLTASEDGEFARADYDSRYAWATLAHQFSPTLDASTRFAWTQTENQRSGNIDEAQDMTASVLDDRAYRVLQLQQDWRWQPTDGFSARWGFDLRRVRGSYNYRREVQFEEELELLTAVNIAPLSEIRASPSGEQLSFYSSNRVSLSDAFSVQIGLRWDRQTYYDFGADEQTSPRLSMLYLTRSGTVLRASWGRFYQPQGINELQVIDGIDRFFRPQRSEHAIVSLNHAFDNGLSLRIEAYSKRITSLRPRFENLFDAIELLPELQADRVGFAPERARSRGVEISLSRGTVDDNLSWWLNYTLARTEDVIGGIDIPRSWDQRHAFSGGAQLRRGSWTLALAGRYHSGWPSTNILLDPVEDGEDPAGGLRLGQRNHARLRNYASIDLRVSRHGVARHGEWTAYLEINNLTNRANQCCVNYDFENDDRGARLIRDSESWLPLIPNIGFSFEF